MNQRMILQRGLAITMLMFFLSGCVGAAPTPIEVVPQVVSTPVPSNPQVVQPRVVTAPPIATTRPTNTGPTTTPDGSETPTPTLPAPIDRPFLMKIDRVSVIVGRGTLLEGRVANGKLQAGTSVEIIGPRNDTLSASVLTILVSNTGQTQVSVGDYARVLVSGISPADLSPGMFLVAAGEFESYEDVLYQLQ